MKCKCISSSNCTKCQFFNFCSSEEFSKILLTILQQSLKEEIISILIANSLRDLNENKVNEIVNNMDLDGTIKSIFRKSPNEENKKILIEVKEEKLLKKKRNEKLIKTVTACPHVDSKHYAKNLCSNCYHRKGRDKKAWACKHVDRIHYAHGLCHNCYQTSHIEKVKQNNIVGD